MKYSRVQQISKLRDSLSGGGHSIGSWMQLPSSSVAEIMAHSGYDWIAVDLEHGSIDVQQLPDLFRALELGHTLPFVRLAQGHPKDCKKALDAGAAGVIVPMVESGKQLRNIREACCWPPEGCRGVGFSRANLFGKYFEEYKSEATAPFFVAMIENVKAVENLGDILQTRGLDALLVGPYDLSASMGLTGEFDHPDFLKIMDQIYALATNANMPCGLHVVAPSPQELEKRIAEGYRFIAYSIDSVFLNSSAANPVSMRENI